MRFSLISAALVASLVGYGSTIALVLSAASALGATPAQTTSWLLATCLAKAIGSAALSGWFRIPLVIAWSTPGAALIAATSGVTLAQAVAAFLLAAGLIVLTGAIRPLERAVSAIPEGVAAAMLAGTLLPFCLKGILAVEALPLLVLPMAGVFLAVRLVDPAIAVLAALCVGVTAAFATGAAMLPVLTLPAPLPVFVAPDWSWSVMLGLGVPLYLVTMASQNLPGFATVRAAGYVPPVQAALVVTGGLSAGAALFGAHTVNMAAITAAICLGDDVHPDRSQRWKVGIAYGAAWLVLALLGPPVLQLLSSLPPDLLAGVVGLALLAPLTSAVTAAVASPTQRFAALVTLVVAASGVAFFGVGAAFWGLLAGLGVHAAEQLRRPVQG